MPRVLSLRPLSHRGLALATQWTSTKAVASPKASPEQAKSAKRLLQIAKQQLADEAKKEQVEVNDSQVRAAVNRRQEWDTQKR